MYLDKSVFQSSLFVLKPLQVFHCYHGLPWTTLLQYRQAKVLHYCRVILHVLLLNITQVYFCFWHDEWTEPECLTYHHGSQCLIQCFNRLSSRCWVLGSRHYRSKIAAAFCRDWLQLDKLNKMQMAYFEKKMAYFENTHLNYPNTS